VKLSLGFGGKVPKTNPLIHDTIKVPGVGGWYPAG